MISMEQSLMDAGLLKPAGTILLRETPPVFVVCPHCRRQLNKHGNCPAHGSVVPMNSAVVNTLPASDTCLYCGRPKSQHSIVCKRPLRRCSDRRCSEYDSSAS